MPHLFQAGSGHPSKASFPDNTHYGAYSSIWLICAGFPASEHELMHHISHELLVSIQTESTSSEFKLLFDPLTSQLTFIHPCKIVRHLSHPLQDSHNYL